MKVFPDGLACWQNRTKVLGQKLCSLLLLGIPLTLPIFQIIEFITRRKLALIAQLRYFGWANEARSLSSLLKPSDASDFSNYNSSIKHKCCFKKHKFWDIHYKLLGSNNRTAGGLWWKIHLKRIIWRWEGMKKKGRKKKQLRLWKWGISMQGELYLEVSCQDKIFFSKPFLT